MKDALLLAAMRCQQTKENGVLTITGKTGSGKSLLAMKAALYGFENHDKVLYVSDEITESLFVEKCNAIYSTCSNIKAGTIHNEYVPHSGNTLAHVADAIRKHNAEMVVLDLCTVDAKSVVPFAIGLSASGTTVVMTQQLKRSA